MGRSAVQALDENSTDANANVDSRTSATFSYPTPKVRKGRFVMAIKQMESNSSLPSQSIHGSRDHAFVTSSQHPQHMIINQNSALLQGIVSNISNPELSLYENVKMSPISLRFNSAEIERKYLADLAERMKLSFQASLLILLTGSVSYVLINYLARKWLLVAISVFSAIVFFIALIDSRKMNRERYYLWRRNSIYIYTFLVLSISYSLDANPSIPEPVVLLILLFHTVSRYAIRNSFPLALILLITACIVALQFLDLYGVLYVYVTIFLVLMFLSTTEYVFERADRLSFLSLSKIEISKKIFASDQDRTRQTLYCIYPRKLVDIVIQDKNRAYDCFESESTGILIIRVIESDHHNPSHIADNTNMVLIQREVEAAFTRYAVEFARHSRNFYVGTQGLLSTDVNPVDSICSAAYSIFSNISKQGLQSRVQICVGLGPSFSGVIKNLRNTYETYGYAGYAMFECWRLESAPPGVYFDRQVMEEMKIYGDLQFRKVEECKNAIWSLLITKLPEQLANVTFPKLELQKSIIITESQDEANDARLKSHTGSDNLDQLSLEEMSVLAQLNSKKLYPIRYFLAITLCIIVSFLLQDTYAVGNVISPENPVPLLYLFLRWCYVFFVPFSFATGLLFEKQELVSVSIYYKSMQSFLKIFMVCYMLFSASKLALLAYIVQLALQFGHESSWTILESLTACILGVYSPIDNIKYQYLIVLIFFVGRIWQPLVAVDILMSNSIHMKVHSVLMQVFIPTIALLMALFRRRNDLELVRISKRNARLHNIRLDKQRQTLEDIVLSVIPSHIYADLKSNKSMGVQSCNSCSVAFLYLTNLDQKLHRLCGKDRVKYLECIIYTLQIIAQGHDVELIKAFGYSFLFASGYRSPGAKSPERMAEFLIDMSIFIHTFELSETCHERISFQISSDYGEVDYGFTDGLHVAFDIWGPAVSSARSLLVKTPINEIQLGARIVDKIYESKNKLIRQRLQHVNRACFLDWEKEIWRTHAEADLGLDVFANDEEEDRNRPENNPDEVEKLFI